MLLMILVYLYRAFSAYLKLLSSKGETRSDWKPLALAYNCRYKCPQQITGKECGFYVAHYMLFISKHPNIHEYEMPDRPLDHSQLIHIRDTLCDFIKNEVLDSKGEFCYTGLQKK